MLSIVAAVISTLAFGFLNLIYKKLIDKGVKPLAVLGLGVGCIPAWIFVGVLISNVGNTPNLGLNYFLSLLIWVLVCFLWGWGSKYLYAHRSLTELKLYGLVIGLALGFIIDWFFLKSDLKVFSIVAALSLLGGGIILSKNSNAAKITDTNNFVSWKLVIAILAFNSVLSVIATTAYKIGLGFQGNILYQVVFSQSALYGLFFLSGINHLKTSFENKLVTKKEVLLIFLLLFVATFFEGFMVKKFPLIILTVLPVLSIALFSFYDFKVGQLHWSRCNILAFLMVIGGLFLSQLNP